MIADKIIELKQELPSGVKLVAVSKFHPVEAIIEAYMAGQRVFAESRPQELERKVKALAAYEDIKWHFIGHLQTNKLKMVLPYVSLVESVDSIHLLEAIDYWGSLNSKVTDILLECHISDEETKQGFSYKEVEALLQSSRTFSNVRIRGLMGMADFTCDENIIRRDFQRLLDINDLLYAYTGISVNLPIPEQNPEVTVSGRDRLYEISMGMSEDYPIAVEMGATMVRIGSLIFGERQY